eukprot:gene3394-6738_t
MIDLSIKGVGIGWVGLEEVVNGEWCVQRGWFVCTYWVIGLAELVSECYSELSNKLASLWVLRWW